MPPWHFPEGTELTVEQCAGEVDVGDGGEGGRDRVGPRAAQQLQPRAELRRPRLRARLEVERHLLQVSSHITSQYSSSLSLL